MLADLKKVSRATVKPNFPKPLPRCSQQLLRKRPRDSESYDEHLETCSDLLAVTVQESDRLLEV